MQKPLTILGIIPARGSSKAIPRKNVKPIAGKPLIAWTIEAAKKSTLMNTFVVSTEDNEIANIAANYGAEVLHRPKALASDKATTLAVMPADIVVLLQCTSPIREKGLIDTCIKQFLNEKADSLATGFISHLYEWGSYDNKRRQDLQGWFHDDGNIYVIKAENIVKGNLWGKKRIPFGISREQNIEIDDSFDFWLNEQILRNKKLWKSQH
jgi:CMP-N,N'-diacetyllegionaminic acid synthase